MKKYLLITAGTELGPFSPDELTNMHVKADTLVRDPEHADEYMRCADVKDIAAALVARNENELQAFNALTDDMQTQAQMHWAPVKADSCKPNGMRQYSAQLMDIPSGTRWEDACVTMPNTVRGHYFARPTRCVNNFGMWGEWDVPDPSCGSKSDINAVVFVKTDIPLHLGHVGWGFKLANGQWCYGATETFGKNETPPGMDNGVFIKQGSKDDMFYAFKNGKTPSNAGWRYQFYKGMTTGNPNPQRGIEAAELTRRMGYGLWGNNCMNHAIKVLNAYAGYPMVPVANSSSPQYWVPNFWFAQITAAEKSTSAPF